MELDETFYRPTSFFSSLLATGTASSTLPFCTIDSFIIDFSLFWSARGSFFCLSPAPAPGSDDPLLLLQKDGQAGISSKVSAKSASSFGITPARVSFKAVKKDASKTNPSKINRG